MKHLILFILAVSLTAFLSCSTESTPVYTLTTSAEPTEGGTLSQAASQAEEGQSIQITATPNEHWELISWGGDLTGTNETTVNVFMDKDRHVIALFEKVEYPLTVTVDGNGSVEQEIIQSKTTDYKHGTVVQLTAKPDIGWEFVEWRGDVTGSDKEILIEIDQEKEVQAIFQIIFYDLTVEVEGEGMVEQENIQDKGTEYPYGTTVQLTAVPVYGWEFDRWEGDLEGSEPEKIVIIDQDKSVKAIFKRAEFSLTVDQVGEGNVEQEIVQGKVRDYQFETTVQLTAIPEIGWEFTGWSGDIDGFNPVAVVTIDKDLVITANFKLVDYNLTIQIFGQGSAFQNGVQVSTKEYPSGTQVNLKAVAADGWVFAGWDGDLFSHNSSPSIIINSDKTIYLYYRQLPTTLRIQPLGDSITHGTAYTYRYELYHKLTGSAYNFRYVGTKNNNPAGYPGVWDTIHEGHIGIHTHGVKALLDSWLGLYTPDLALIHLGTNDIFEADIYSYNLDVSVSNMESIIDKLRKGNPVIRIYLAKIIPIGEDSGSSYRLYQERRTEWNAALENIANQKRTDVSPIYIVNMADGFSESDLEDGVHPTEEGAKKMAQQWMNSISTNN